jgi:antitoxin ParD1/3/4
MSGAMEISIGERWEAYVKRLVNEGRFASERDVICMGLRLLEEQGRKLKILRDEINAAIEEGGSHTAEVLTQRSTHE